MIKVRLTKLSDNQNALRTRTVEGETPRLPGAGERFIVWAEGLDFGARYVQTSQVQHVEQLGSQIRFRTLNTDYMVELM